jgi:phage terminase small subunit
VKAPGHLTDELRAVWLELRPTLKAGTPPALVEAICCQVHVMRGARAAIELDGLMVRDGRNNPIPHPALEVERLAGRQLRDLLGRWAK